MQSRASIADDRENRVDVRAEEARARAALYGLVGRCLEEELDHELLRLVRGDLRQALGEAGWQLDADLFGQPEASLLEAMAEEFTGLFVAPGGVSPYASVFETGAMFREPCDRAAAAYREAGFEYRRRMSGEFPDHIGTMLAFVGALAAEEADAIARGDREAEEAWRERGQAFLTDQLGRWAPAWCRRAANASLRPFYRDLLQFTEQLLWQDLATAVDRRGLKELMALNQREPKKLDYDADFRKASGL